MLKLRQASMEDCKLIWKWANDPNVRAVSFSSEAISYEHHVRWFELKLEDASCFFYIAENTNEEPIGQVRYEIDGNKATINISVARQFRGTGYGSHLIRFASKKLFSDSEAEVIHAYVKEGNEVSLRAFKKAGFMHVGTKIISKHKANYLIFNKMNQVKI
jgi:RimJ/RimL family protein N-acetyltransferase